MKKDEFLKELSRQLRGVRIAERQRTLAFYDEMISDAEEDGMDEEKAVEKLGSVESIAARVIAEAQESGDIKPKGRPLSTALIIIGSPLWLVLLIAAAAVILAMYIVVWSVIISLFAAVAALAAGGIAGVVSLALLAGQNMSLAFFGFGAGLVCAGLCVLCAYPVWLLTKKLAVETGRLCAKMWTACIDRFRRKK